MQKQALAPFGKKQVRLLLFVSALLSVFPLTFPSFFFLSWFSWIPFFLVFLSPEKPRFRTTLFRGFFFGFFYHAFVYFWFLWLYPFDSAGFSKPVAAFVVLVAWLGISAGHGLLFMIPAALEHIVKKFFPSRLFRGLCLVGAILAIEKLTEFSTVAFPWVRVSLGQYRAPVLIQFASVLGILGVDLLILLCNLLLALALTSRQKKRIAAFSMAALLFAGNFVFGLVRLHQAPQESAIRVSLVQGCILSGEKWEADGLRTAVQTHLSLTEEAAAFEPDLVVWSESAIPITISRPSNAHYLEEFQEESAAIGTPILLGTFTLQEGETCNSVILVTEDAVSAPYSKRHLVPFGEYLPYRVVLSRVFPGLENINQLSSDLKAGDDAALFTLGEKKLGAMICFESIFQNLARESTAAGAQLLVIATNDSWYEDSPAASQHLAHAVFRSVENGRDTIRCANSGISAFITARGEITAELGVLQQGVLNGTAAYSSEKTVYTAVGDLFLPVFWGLLVLTGGAIQLYERKRHGR